MESLVLASASPRRVELLSSCGIAFRQLAADVDESRRDNLAPAQRVLALAQDKAQKAAELLREKTDQQDWPSLILGADTLVCVQSEEGEAALGKARDRQDARAMIQMLSGRCHTVRTGVALLDRHSGWTRTIRSDSIVSFAEIQGNELDTYLDSEDWQGVAGAYKIQGRAALYIDNLQGSYSGVVGLPLRELYVILEEAVYRNPTSRDSVSH